MQRCIKVPLLLNNIRKYTDDPDEKQQLTESLQKLETSLRTYNTTTVWNERNVIHITTEFTIIDFYLQIRV